MFHALWVIAFALTPVLAVDSEVPDTDEPIIPPGQEELLVQMLGRGTTLPDDCTFRAGQAEYTKVTATYACPGGDVVLELAHPDVAAGAEVETEQFGITVQSGAPPAGLADAVAATVRSHEDAFQWARPARDVDDAAPE